MNWGKGIAIAMGMFIVFIVILASTLMSHKVDLVSEDYYQQEVNYQDEIDARERGYSFQPIIATIQDDYLSIRIPDDWSTRQVEVVLTRPNDQTLDRKYSITDTKSLLVPLRQLTKGAYTLRSECLIDGKKTVQFTTIVI